jgi:thioredoxin-like negative regulator of GroEL
MELIEVTMYELKIIKEAHMKPLVVFVHTPLCGTCKLAKRMLQIALEPLENKVIAIACNLNQMPNLAQNLNIQSVPCLILMDGKKVYKKIFSFQSVPNLYTHIQEFTEITKRK